jgi:hypothetical protein
MSSRRVALPPNPGGLPRSTAEIWLQQSGSFSVRRQDEINKMQEALRDKEYYAAQIDGVFGLQTRARNSGKSKG